MKVEKVLNSLSATDRNRFRKFLESPYFNANNDILLLFDAIDSNVRKSNFLSPEKYWSSAYHKKNFNSSLFRKNCSVILKQFELFCSVESLLANELIQKELFEMQLQLKTSLDLVGTKKFIELGELNSKEQLQAIDYHKLFTINKLRFESQNNFEKRARIEKAQDKTINFSELDSALVVYYTLERLKLGLMANNLSQISTEMIPVIIKEPELDTIQLTVHRHPNHLLLQIYWTLYGLLVSSDHELDYRYILEALSGTSLSRTESLLIYEYLLNYFVREGNKIPNGFEQRHHLHQLGLMKDYFLLDGQMDPIDYSNIIFTACRIGNFSWALSFAEEYKEKLSSEYRKTAYSFNKARIHWYEQDFESVIETLRNVEYEDLTYNLNSKLMLLTSFFELDEYDLVDSTIKSFKVFLRRRRNIPSSRKKAFYGFCEVLGHILKAEERSDKKRLVQARKSLDAGISIPNIAWLREKIDQVEQILA